MVKLDRELKRLKEYGQLSGIGVFACAMGKRWSRVRIGESYLATIPICLCNSIDRNDHKEDYDEIRSDITTFDLTNTIWQKCVLFEFWFINRTDAAGCWDTA